MRRCRIKLPNRCYHLISRVTHRAFEGGQAAKSLSSAVFPPVVSPTCFNPDWNLARVVSRGAETVRVESKVSVVALKLRIR